MGRRSRSAAARWLERRKDVSWAGLAPDGQTVEVRFRNGATGVIVHVDAAARSLAVPSLRATPRLYSRGPTSGRALVLEPFASQLALGPSAGATEIDALTSAGFRVDVYRDSAVTIPVIEGMADYAVVYMESHSGVCGPPLCAGDDVFVLTGAQVPSSLDEYAPLFADGSMTEGVTDTQPGIIYLAFTSRLIQGHVGTFPDSSLVFINGCDLQASPGFIQALTSHGAATVYSWNRKVYNFDAEAAADFMFPRLAAGETAAGTLANARGAGLGVSLADEDSTLTLTGDPALTLAEARVGATPTPTLTATPTPTPTATVPPSSSVTNRKRPCKKGYRRVHGTCRKKVKKPAR